MLENLIYSVKNIKSLSRTDFPLNNEGTTENNHTSVSRPTDVKVQNILHKK
jgi:hypothetical protein